MNPIKAAKKGKASTTATISRPWCFCVFVVAFALLSTMSRDVAGSDNGSPDPYESESSGRDDPRVHSLNDYLAGGILEDSLLGMTLRQDSRQLKSGAYATGLLIVAIEKGKPAANNGLKPVHETTKQMISVIAVVGSMAFPPAILLWPVGDALIGEGGDLIIAADGSRVRNAADFENQVRQARPGEIVYLTIVRSGVRKQLAIPIPQLEER